MQTKTLLLTSSLAIFAALPALAAPVNFHADEPFIAFDSNGEGEGRGITFQANENFSITSVGIFFNLLAMDFDVNIYNSTDGSDVTSVINTASENLGGLGAQYYDIAISQSFVAGNYYGISWTPSVDVDWADTTPPESYYADSALPFDVGPATLLDGFEGFDMSTFEFGNVAHAALRVNVVDMPAVPLPASLPLLAGALGALGWMRGRRKA